MGIVIGVGVVGFFVALHIWATVASMRMTRNMANEGFEHCGQVGNKHLWVKGNEVRIGSHFSGANLEKFVPIEIIKLSEVTRNAKLIELEIRYRINGEVKSARVRDSQDKLLTYADRLGYS